MGHGGRQPRLVAHGRPDGNWLEVARLDHNRGKIHEVAVASFELTGRTGASAGASARAAHRAHRHRGPAVPQGRARQGRDRQVPRRPAGRAEGRLRRRDHLGALGAAPDAGAHAHRVPGVLRPRARRDSVDRRDQGLLLDARTRADGAQLAGLEHLDERYLRAVGYATKIQARRAAEDGAARRHRRRRRGCGRARDVRSRAHREQPLRRRLRRGQRGCAQEILARPLAHGGDRAAHQRVQDQRRRGDSARRAWASTPIAIERINIELSFRQQAAAAR